MDKQLNCGVFPPLENTVLNQATPTIITFARISGSEGYTITALELETKGQLVLLTSSMQHVHLFPLHST